MCLSSLACLCLLAIEAQEPGRLLSITLCRPEHPPETPEQFYFVREWVNGGRLHACCILKTQCEQLLCMYETPTALLAEQTCKGRLTVSSP